MVDYIEQQWLALCDVNEWGSVLCRDLRLLLLTWLNQDADVQFARKCTYRSMCYVCDDCNYLSRCWSKHVKHPERHDVCMLAVQTDGYNLEGIVNQTEAMCLVALQKTPVWAFCYVRNQTEALCLTAVKQSSWCLHYVENQTPAVIEAALNQDPPGCRPTERVGSGIRVQPD
jgi:hypothetical protein